MRVSQCGTQVRDETDPTRCSIRALHGYFCDSGIRARLDGSGSRRIVTGSANASAAADYGHRTITDDGTGESVASIEHRPNSTIRISEPGSESTAVGDLGDDLRSQREFVADGERFFYF